MEFSLLCCKFYISPVFVLLLTALMLLDTTGQMPLIICAAAIHEAGHITAMAVFKAMPKNIRFLPFAIDMKCPSRLIPTRRELIIHSAGIAANLLFGFVSLIILKFSFSDSAAIFCAANFGILLFNLLPVFSLDGQHILRCVLALLGTDNEKSARILHAVSVVITVILCIGGGYIMIKSFNPTLLLFGVYVLLLSFKYKNTVEIY